MATLAPFAGRLDARIEILQRTEVKDALNNRKETWPLLCNAWAQADYTGGAREVDGAIMDSAQRAYIVYTRADVLAKATLLRVRHDGAEFNVHRVDKIGRSHLKLYCTAYDNDATR